MMKNRVGMSLCALVSLLAVLVGCVNNNLPASPIAVAPTLVQTMPLTQVPLLRGLAYSPYRDCQSADTLEQPGIAEITQDLEIVSKMANGIRTYSTTGINGEIPSLARQFGLRVSAGAWLGSDQAANEREINYLIEIAKRVELESVIVGNEVLLRNDLTEAELIAYIQRVKDAVDVPVTTAEIGSVLLQHPNVIDSVDYLLVHLYPFWEGKPIDQATRLVARDYHDIQTKSNGKRVVIGETGWPSGGPPVGAAVPSHQNQALFAKEFFTIAELEDIEFYYFGTFDEMWKSEGGVGPYWGLLYADRTFKYDIQNVMSSYNAVAQTLRDETPALVTAQPTLQGSEDSVGDFYISSNFGSLSDHFAPGGWMGDYERFEFSCNTEGQVWPGTTLRVVYSPTEDDPNGWGGVYWLQPDQNWGTIPGVGFDLTDYQQLIFRARAEVPGTQVKFFVGGVASGEDGSPLLYPSSIISPVFAQEADPVDGFVNLSNSWQEYHIDLRRADLSYVIDGFGWAMERARTPAGAVIYLDDIRYVQSEPPLWWLYPVHIYSGEMLRPGLELGVDSSGHQYDWVEDLKGAMKISYPPGQEWGSVYITVGRPQSRNDRQSMPLTLQSTLSMELRGELGGEVVFIGIKDRLQPDNGSETLIPVKLTSDWQTYTFDRNLFIGVDPTDVYIPIEFVFKHVGAETIYFRNVQYLP